MNTPAAFPNPFRPGAGHMPPYLAGRENETREFLKLLRQETILENMVLTGLRGTGKTVLMETFRPLAIGRNWAWVGTDLSESASLTEERLAIRLITDLSVHTASKVVHQEQILPMGFTGLPSIQSTTLDYHTLKAVFDQTPGLTSDKLRTVLELVWNHIGPSDAQGIVFAYDEAQNLADHSAKNEYPLSLLLDVFQSIQRKGIRFMLLLTGLPTLFPKLVEARTYAERMFHVVALTQLDETASGQAIEKPIETAECPIQFTDEAIRTVIDVSGGYPYFIQFICREVFDIYISQIGKGLLPSVPVEEIVHKLDNDFFSGRWARATDRQRDLLMAIAMLDNCDSEFTVQEVVEKAKEILANPFSSSHVNQMLTALSKHGLVYKNRHGRYSFAVPLLGQYIRRVIRSSGSSSH